MKHQTSLLENLLMFLFVLLALVCTTLPADGFIVIPRPPRPGPVTPFPLEVVSHKVDVAISDLLATTTIDQEFFNPNNSRLEGYYLFPLPAGAAIKNFSMWIDGRETRAELLDAVKARNIYEDIVRRLRDPALLEYDGRGVFKVRIFPIEPRSKKRIKISYHELLQKDNGAIAYQYPLNTEKFSAKAIESVVITLNIESTVPLAAIHCPTHPISITRRGARRAMVVHESSHSLPNSDFKIFMTPKSGPLGFSLLTYRESGQEGVFFLSTSPGFSAAADEVSAKDITFVMDTSGSMAGRSLEQAKGALRYCLERLNRDDRFNIIRFATEAEPLFRELRPAAAGNLDQARDFIGHWQAVGGTNCDDALQMALAASPDSNRPNLIVLITDGKPTIGETSEEALLGKIERANRGRFKIFPVAIGSDINTHLLDKIAEQTRTFRTYIAASENIENGIARFYDKIQSPVLSSVRMTVSGKVRVNQLYPRELPDLYRGSTLTVCGRYQGCGPAVIEVTGQVNGRSKRFVFHADFPAQRRQHDFLPRLWAARRVGFLLDQIRLHGENRELVDEVTRLARLHGIITPYTSYLIVEDEKIRRERGDLAENDMTLGRVAAASPGFAKKQEEEFSKLKRDKDGGSGVRISDELQNLNQAQAVSETMSGAHRLSYRDRNDRERNLGRQVRTVAGRTFYYSGVTWVDAGVQSLGSLPLKRIAFASDAYFDWLEKEPACKPFLALGRNLKFVWKKQLIEIY
ncbi:MAG: VWA domain-containing protein [Candidatus Aminicenantes bacterium]|nr:VWA domain-containing protein [Candidatus Aminicenantes bacterium]